MALPPALLTEIHKSALGAEDTMEWTYVENTTDAVRILQLKGYKVWAVEQTEGAAKLSSDPEIMHNSQKAAFVFGNEVRCTAKVVNLCDGVLKFSTRHQAFFERFGSHRCRAVARLPDHEGLVNFNRGS